ncbi:MAG: hypothetical protein Q4C54_09405 [Clostridia bacterium]|nr:hypothetical protein [Clostridia bacterium]
MALIKTLVEDAASNGKPNGVPAPEENEIRGTVKCGNPRCITCQEETLPQIFRLKDADEKVYRCVYCDWEHKA